jgi:hypothetical protein
MGRFVDRSKSSGGRRSVDRAIFGDQRGDCDSGCDRGLPDWATNLTIAIAIAIALRSAFWANLSWRRPAVFDLQLDSSSAVLTRDSNGFRVLL